MNLFIFQKTQVLVLLTCCIIFNATSQFDYSFIGFVKAEEIGIVPYKITFSTDADDSLFGQSHFDFNGKNSTSSEIKGKISSRGKQISFIETLNISSQSNSESSDFCFLRLESVKINNKKDNSVISGDFTSSFTDNTPCINGKIYLVSENFINLIEEKINSQDSLKAQQQIAQQLLSNVKKNTVTLENQERIEINTQGSVELYVYDKHSEDGDRITILLNGEVLERDLTLKNDKKKYLINCKSEKCNIKILALNEGEFPPNTVEIEIKDNKYTTPITGQLNKGEALYIDLLPK